MTKRTASCAEWRLIGRGASAGVFSCRCPTTGCRVALKVVHNTDLARREREMLRSCQNHPHVVRLLEQHAPFDGLDGSRTLVLDLYSRSLHHLLSDRTLKEPSRLLFAVHISDALSHMHARGVVHCDVKPANVLIDGAGRNAVLADFGLARRASELVDGCLTTLRYAAPETRLNGCVADDRIDVWGWGCVFVDMCVGLKASKRVAYGVWCLDAVCPQDDERRLLFDAFGCASIRISSREVSARLRQMLTCRRAESSSELAQQECVWLQGEEDEHGV